MSKVFFETSKEVSGEFLQSITFIDDEASYSESKDVHRLNAQTVTEMFASQGKLCTIYKVTKTEDLENVFSLAKKSDVTVLDWRIKFEIDNEEEGEIDDETDDEEDIRGKFTLEVIQKLLSEKSSRLKLIMIYTGENDFDSIISDIQKALQEINVETNKDGFDLQHNNYKISLYGKATLKGRRLRKEIEDRLLEYSELPGAITEKFAQLSTGLISNVTLKALSVIRENTFRLLDSFDKSIDAAFLAHKALLPNPDDASQHIIDIIGSDIKSLIKGNNTSDLISNENVLSYIKENVGNPVSFSIQEHEKFKEIDIPKELSNDNLSTIMREGIESVFLRREHPFEEQVLFSKNCPKTLTNCFSKDDESGNQSNIRFAVLTTLKTFYNEEYLPILTQGTILKDEKKEEYWLCIQPKCDSVRIETKKRAFLILRLIKVGNDRSFDIAIDNQTFLKIDYSIFKSQFVDFKKGDNGSVNLEVNDDGTKKYQRHDNKYMIWIGELKSDYAQYISNKYAADLSRVGVDHSEWLRRS